MKNGTIVNSGNDGLHLCLGFPSQLKTEEIGCFAPNLMFRQSSSLISQPHLLSFVKLLGSLFYIKIAHDVNPKYCHRKILPEDD
jgi:hypothetical protein